MSLHKKMHKIHKISLIITNPKSEWKMSFVQVVRDRSEHSHNLLKMRVNTYIFIICEVII